MINNFLIVSGMKGEDRKGWHKERLAPEFSVQGGSTNNDRRNCNGIYQCKMAGEDFIEGDNNVR